jgi:predicted TIM-barrel fold metal-dependent hydrolase
MLPIIDTHLHIWDFSRFVLPELESYESLKRNFLLSDAAQAIKNLNVEKIVYMEVNLIQEQKYSEAEYITEICKQDDNPISAAFIGGDPLSCSFRDYAPLFKDNKYIKGVRHILHTPEVKRGYCLESEFIDSIRLLGELGLRFCICIRPSELTDAVKLAELCPETSLILDHCGNGVPDIVYGAVKESEYGMDIFRHNPDQWKKDIEALAERDNVVCKISGLLFKTDPGSVTPEFLAPAINHCLDTFGPDRVMFGSNWPVCTLTTSYETWLSVLNEVVQDRSDEFKSKLFYKNAESIYGL